MGGDPFASMFGGMGGMGRQQAPSPGVIKSGSQVRIHGLNGAPQHNGKCGRYVLSFSTSLLEQL